MTGLVTARALAAMGFNIFPIRAGAKAPPLWANWPVLARPTTAPDQWPGDCNVGIHCKGLCVVDVDPLKGGSESLLALDIDYGWPDTLTALTPSGGQHIFYRLPEGHPGVANSVSKPDGGVLGLGIDIRSTGGYVVGAGSRTTKGEYRWFNSNATIAPAPDWLVQKLGVYTTRVQAAPVYIPDADGVTVERAEAWLAARPGAVEGQGGDAFTFATAAFLRDYGLSQLQTFTIMADQWNPRCSPPWNPEELADKVANVYKYAGGEPGSKAVTANDFPEITPNGNIPANEPAKMAPSSRSGTAVRLGELVNRSVEGPGYLIKGLLAKGSYAELYGPPGSGKTFVALDLAYHVAAGTPWMDRRVKAGLSLYLAYEGTGGIVKRAQALRRKYGTVDVPMYVTAAAYNLRELPGRQAIGSLLASLPEKPSLIVIDTFARALMGGDENSAQDVGAFNAGVAALIDATGACVLILHHTGKDVTRGARGSSAIQGAVDTEIAIDGKSMLPTKQRDMETGTAIGYKLVPIIVGLDTDDEDITSCIVDPAAVAAETNGVRLTGNMASGWEVLIRLRPDNAPISLEEWRDGCREFLGDRSVRQRFFELRTRLERLNLIVVTESGAVTRRME